MREREGEGGQERERERERERSVSFLLKQYNKKQGKEGARAKNQFYEIERTWGRRGWLSCK